MFKIFRGEDGEDNFDEVGERYESHLNAEIDALLADNSRWHTPNWKSRYWMRRIFWFVIGVIFSMFVLKYYGF